MQQILQQLKEIYAKNPPLRMLFAVGVFLLALGLLLAVKSAAIRHLRAWHRGKLLTDTTDAAANLLARTNALLILLAAAYAGLRILDLPDSAITLLKQIFIVVLLVQAVFWINALIETWVERFRKARVEIDAAAVTTIAASGFILRLVIWILALMTGLAVFEVPIGPLVASLGIAGVAVGLAAQNVLGDLFASLAIVLDKPFAIGDFIVIDDLMGTVETIGIKTTRLRSLWGEQLVFSNSDLLKGRIHNYKRMAERRVLFGFGVTYQTPRDKLAAIPGLVREIVERQAPRTRFDRAHFTKFGESALDFEVVYYVLSPDYIVTMDVQQAINLDLVAVFERESIHFAYPTRTVVIEGQMTKDKGQIE